MANIVDDILVTLFFFVYFIFILLFSAPDIHRTHCKALHDDKSHVH